MNNLDKLDKLITWYFSKNKLVSNKDIHNKVVKSGAYKAVHCVSDDKYTDFVLYWKDNKFITLRLYTYCQNLAVYCDGIPVIEINRFSNGWLGLYIAGTNNGYRTIDAPCNSVVPKELFTLTKGKMPKKITKDLLETIRKLQ